MDKTIRLLIADDHSIIRTGLKQFFALIEDICVSCEADSGKRLLSLLQRRTDFDVLLLDLTLPDISGLDLIPLIHSSHPDLPILVFTIHSDLAIAKQAFERGARGFVMKGCPAGLLIVAIRTVSSGGRYVDPELAEHMFFAPPAEPETPHQKLTERELHILKLLAKGMSGNEIARSLSISKKTVSTHKSNMMLKMDFHNIAELVLYAAQYSLID
ncbi:MAG TPA: response regulator transcription factor [Gallionella sp.]|nr:response regulator transcription factor [Gallionella sp.]